jgi:hypothetical protein
VARSAPNQLSGSRSGQGDTRLRRGRGDRGEIRIDQGRAGVGGVQALTDDLGHRGAAGTVVIVGVRLLAGVGAEQAVEGVATGTMLGKQVPAGKFGQQRSGLAGRNPGQAGRGIDCHVGAGMQTEQPEQPRRARAQRMVGPGEHRPDIGGYVTAVERVEDGSGLAQFGGCGREGETGPGGGAGGDDS